MIEIERKFIPLVLPEELHLYPKSEIIQSYYKYVYSNGSITSGDISISPPFSLRGFFEANLNGVIRIRMEDESVLSFTVKSGAGLVREETEWREPIIRDSGKYFGKSSIIKDRFTVSEDSTDAFYDIFKERYTGVSFCEIEFSSIEKANSFIVPFDFIDVTENALFTNASMFFSDSKILLNEYGRLINDYKNQKSHNIA